MLVTVLVVGVLQNRYASAKSPRIQVVVHQLTSKRVTGIVKVRSMLLSGKLVLMLLPPTAAGLGTVLFFGACTSR